MSGGSFEYLYTKGFTEILESGMDDLARMGGELEALGHLAKAPAERTRALAERLRTIEREINAEAASLERVWHAVEWWRSGDWGKDQVFVAIGEWRERERQAGAGGRTVFSLGTREVVSDAARGSDHVG